MMPRPTYYSTKKTDKRSIKKRVLIYAPSGQDAMLASKILTLAHIDNLVTATTAQLVSEMLLG